MEGEGSEGVGGVGGRGRKGKGVRGGWGRGEWIREERGVLWLRIFFWGGGGEGRE